MRSIKRSSISDEAAARQMAGAEIEGRPIPPAGLPTFTLDCASQGREALEMVIQARQAGRPFAVAFVDMRMPPGWDGIETIEQLWKVEPALEVVICTAFIDFSADDIVRRLRRTDQVLLLKKPFDGIEVRLLAFALAEKWRLAREAQSHFDNLEALIKARTRELEQSISLIKSSENQYRLLFESNPTPIYTFDQESLAFLAVNDAAVLHYGLLQERVPENDLARHCLAGGNSRLPRQIVQVDAGHGLFRRLAASHQKRQAHRNGNHLAPAGNAKTVALPGRGCDGTLEPRGPIAPGAKNGVRRPVGRRHRP